MILRPCIACNQRLEFALSSIWFSLTGTFKEMGNSYDVTLTTPSSESFKSEKPSSKCCEFLNGQVGNISVKKLYLSFKLKKICSTSSNAVAVCLMPKFFLFDE